MTFLPNLSPLFGCVAIKEWKLRVRAHAIFERVKKRLVRGDRDCNYLCVCLLMLMLGVHVWVCHLCAAEGTMDVLTARAHAHLLNGRRERWKISPGVRQTLMYARDQKNRRSRYLFSGKSIFALRPHSEYEVCSRTHEHNRRSPSTKWVFIKI